jgi:hypothetical protein
MDSEKKTIDVDSIVLEFGSHESPEVGMCVMEAVAYVAGEEFSDRPKCASETIAAFMRAWNDSLNDEQRQMLRPYIRRLVGTAAGKEAEAERAWLAIDWYVRVFTPTWLEVAGLHDHAETLRTLNRLTTDAELNAADGKLSAARSAAESAAESAAWSAAWSAAESAAWSAARSAARSAAESAAESAAWSAAESAAESVAWSAAESVAWSAAWSAAESAAWSAAESAARSAAWSAAWSAAESAAEKALEPTVTRLQQSALDLLNRMIAVSGQDRTSGQ